MGAVALLWGGSSPPPPRSSSAADSPAPWLAPPASASTTLVAAVAPARAVAVTDPRLESLVQRLVALLGRSDVGDEDEQGRLERQLLEAGEQAAAPIVARLRREQDPARRDLLLDFLRKVPGSVAEAYFIEEARAGARGSSRTLAIDALADRRSDTALEALNQIATSDPELPQRPFLVEPRKPDDDSTELPDETTFTPRMKAMAALASTQDPRVTPMLSDMLREQPDESLRWKPRAIWHSCAAIRPRSMRSWPAWPASDPRTCAWRRCIRSKASWMRPCRRS